MSKIIMKQPCEEIPEVDEGSESSTINVGVIEVFKVRARSLVAPNQPRDEPSPIDSPQDTSSDEPHERCVLM